jgi:parallel beta-helix repeat protein
VNITKNICGLFLLAFFLHCSPVVYAQLNFTVNSLADDEFSYAWDDPSTPEDESIDGVCNDELGRCTLGAAYGESFNMNEPVNIAFSVSGTINLINTVYLLDGSSIDGGGQVELTNQFACMAIGNNTSVYGLKFSGAFIGVGLSVDGQKNQIGGLGAGANEFVTCQIGMIISGDSNEVICNYIGLDKNNNLMGNQFGIMIVGNNNQIGRTSLLYSNKVCGNYVAGIQMAVGSFNNIQANYIGTTTDGLSGYGNTQGILLTGSSYNTIGGTDNLLGNIISGNTQHGIYITGPSTTELSENNEIMSNNIGLSPLQVAAVPNGNGIVLTDGSINNHVNGNIIAGNNQSGIYVFALYDSLAATDHTIQNNYIGINDQSVIFPNGNGILIRGHANSITIGSDVINNYNPNYVIGNQGIGGIVVDSTRSPKQIWVRRNDIYQNTPSNLIVTPNANLGIQPPTNISMNGNTLSGIHQLANAVIDIYEANSSEGSASAYQWLGSTLTNSSGVFAFNVTDPSIDAFSLTASTTAMGSSSFAYFEVVTSVQDKEETPSEFSLGQNYPNPFNPSTTIFFSIPNESFVSLKVFNSLGEEVAELVRETKPAGNYSVSFDGNNHSGNVRNLTSGIYFYKISAGSFTQTKKMILLR